MAGHRLPVDCSNFGEAGARSGPTHPNKLFTHFCAIFQSGTAKNFHALFDAQRVKKAEALEQTETTHFGANPTSGCAAHELLAAGGAAAGHALSLEPQRVGGHLLLVSVHGFDVV